MLTACHLLECLHLLFFLNCHRIFCFLILRVSEVTGCVCYLFLCFFFTWSNTVWWRSYVWVSFDWDRLFKTLLIYRELLCFWFFLCCCLCERGWNGDRRGHVYSFEFNEYKKLLVETTIIISKISVFCQFYVLLPEKW